MKLIFLLLAFLSLNFYTQPDPDIAGIWESKGTTGNVGGLNLKKDGTFASYVNKKAFTSGRYTYTNGLFSFTEDNGCTNPTGGKIKAVTKLVFFAQDSFRIEVVIDSCEGRRKAVEGSRFGRVKKVE